MAQRCPVLAPCLREMSSLLQTQGFAGPSHCSTTSPVLMEVIHLSSPRPRLEKLAVPIQPCLTPVALIASSLAYDAHNSDATQFCFLRTTTLLGHGDPAIPVGHSQAVSADKLQASVCTVTHFGPRCGTQNSVPFLAHLPIAWLPPSRAWPVPSPGLRVLHLSLSCQS